MPSPVPTRSVPPGPDQSGYFTRAVVTLVSGTALAQVFVYAARPLLTRLFTPEAFGLLSFYLGLVAVLNTASTLRYEDAVMLPERPREARALVLLSAMLLLGFSVMSALVLPWRQEIAARFHAPELAPYLGFVPAGVLAIGWSRLAEVWFTRHQRFGGIARSRLLQSAAVLPVQIGAGLSGIGAGGLIAGTVGGWIAAAAFLTRGVPLHRPRLLHRAGGIGTLRAVARRYRKFPLFALPGTLLNAASNQIPAFLLLLYFDPGILGLYALAYSVISVPMGLIGSSVGQVYFAHAVQARRGGTLDRLTQEVVQRQIRFGFFPALLVVLAGPSVFAFVFGDVWREAGVYAQYIAPWSFFVFIASPLTRLFDVLERQRSELFFNAVLFVARIGALAVGGGLFHEARVAIALYGLSGALLWSMLTLWILRMSGASIGAALRSVLMSGTLSVPAACVLLLLPALPGHDGWATLLAASALVVYGITLYLWEKRSGRASGDAYLP